MFHYVVFALLLFVATKTEQTAAQRCTLNSAQIADKKHVYLTRNSHGWALLNRDYVQYPESLHLLCTETDRTETKCLSNGSFSVALPYGGPCPHPMRVRIEALNEPQCRQLGGIMYRVGYRLGTEFLEIYRTCYNEAAVQALYVQHHVYHFNVAATTYRRPDFSGDFITPASRKSFMASSVYDRFRELLGTQQAYISNNRDVVVERGHLAPSGDFVSYDQMDGTFRYINVMPQFRGPNRSNWKRIEMWIKRLPQAGAQPVRVLSGTYGVVELPHSLPPHQLVPIYLLSNNRNPMPKWLYKVVRHGNQCTVIVTYNNQFVQTTNLPATLCIPEPCPTELVFNADVTGGYSYCCNYQSFVGVVGSHARLC